MYAFDSLYFKSCSKTIYRLHSGGNKKIGPAKRRNRFFGGSGWIRTTEAYATDLQSAPFGHSGTPPYSIARAVKLALDTLHREGTRESGDAAEGGANFARSAEFPEGGLCSPEEYNPPARSAGAGGRTRTPDLLITNQLLYQLSYTSIRLRPTA